MPQRDVDNFFSLLWLVGLIAAWAGLAALLDFIGQTGPLALAVAFGGPALGLALWALRAWKLIRRAAAYRLRAWFLQLAWAGVLGALTEPIWRAALAGDAPPVAVGAGLAAAALSLLGYFLGFLSLKPPLAAGDTWVERGTQIVTAAEAQVALWGKKPKLPESLIRIGGVTVPPPVENKHFLFTGTTGSGKTQAIARLLDAVYARGGRAIVADAGGEFLGRYATRGDCLLNPFDKRTDAWSPFAEIQRDYDCQRIAEAAIPAREGSAGEWNHYARTLLGETLLAMHRAGEASTAQLLDYLTAAPREELADLLVATPAAAVVGPGNERMLGSVRSILASYLGAWRHLPDRGTFSVRQWVRDEHADNWLFVTYRDDQMALLRNLVATWVELALIETLTLSENEDRDLWFVLDELDSLGTVSSLALALAKLRKHGGRVVLGAQTIAQLRQTYGRDTAQTICANAASKLILRAGDHETAEFCARELGQQEIGRFAVSHGTSTATEDFSPRSESEQSSVQHTRRDAVMAAELLALPDLEGYLTLAGVPAVVRVALEYRERPIREPPFEPRAETELAAVAVQPARGAVQPMPEGSMSEEEIARLANAFVDAWTQRGDDED